MVAKNVIDATQTSLVGALKNLDPVVKRLTAVGDALPGALRIAGTFPFPLGMTRQIIKGDYANLDVILNLNLTDTLCGLTGLCLTARARRRSSSAPGHRASSRPARSNGATQVGPDSAPRDPAVAHARRRGEVRPRC